MTMYLPERILVAPSGFKESLSAVEVADAIAAGIRRVLPGVRVDTFPVPDGGEGTIDILAKRPGTKTHQIKVTGPVGKKVTATWLEFTNEKVAVMEMASAAGLKLVPKKLRDPGLTTTYGVGEVLTDILDSGIRQIVVGCGDSGTSDGGAGALSALGARILDSPREGVHDCQECWVLHNDDVWLHHRFTGSDGRLFNAAVRHNRRTHAFGPKAGERLCMVPVFESGVGQEVSRSNDPLPTSSVYSYLCHICKVRGTRPN